MKYKLRRLWFRIQAWLNDHEPVICFRCGHVLFKKDSTPEQSTTGIIVRFCDPCHKEVFNPFEHDLTPDDVKVMMSKYDKRRT